MKITSKIKLLVMLCSSSLNKIYICLTFEENQTKLWQLDRTIILIITNLVYIYKVLPAFLEVL